MLDSDGVPRRLIACKNCAEESRDYRPLLNGGAGEEQLLQAELSSNMAALAVAAESLPASSLGFGNALRHLSAEDANLGGWLIAVVILGNCSSNSVVACGGQFLSDLEPHDLFPKSYTQ